MLRTEGGFREAVREGPRRDPPGQFRNALGGRAASLGWHLTRVVLLLVSLGGVHVHAQEGPDLVCSARVVGGRVLLSVDVRRFFDAESLRLVRLGLVGRIRVEAGVYRKKWGFFEQAVGNSSSEVEVAYASRGFLLGAHPLEDPATAFGLPVHSIRLGRVPRGVPLTLRAEVRLQVVTVASLSKVAAWATGSEQEDSDILTRGLLSAVVEDLTRSATCTCAVDGAAKDD